LGVKIQVLLVENLATSTFRVIPGCIKHCILKGAWFGLSGKNDCMEKDIG
jgi:hypothetical protein